MFDKLILKENMSEKAFVEKFNPTCTGNDWYPIYDGKSTLTNPTPLIKGYKLNLGNITCEFVNSNGKPFKSHLKIDGSWSKYDSGENFTSYSLIEFQKNYRKLISLLNYDIRNMKLYYMEYGFNVIMNQSADYYLEHLIDHIESRMRDCGFSDNETISFKNGQREIKFYDKSKELIRNDYSSKELKKLCKGLNILRIEMRRNNNDIKKFLNEDTTFEILLDPDVWEILIEDLRDIYFNQILKNKIISNDLVIGCGKDQTRALMMLGKQYLEEKGLKLIYNESMSKSSKSKQSKNYRELTKLEFGDTNPLIEELDRKVDCKLSSLMKTLYSEKEKYNFYPEIQKIDSNTFNTIQLLENDDQFSLVIVDTESGEQIANLYSTVKADLNIPKTKISTYSGPLGGVPEYQTYQNQ